MSKPATQEPRITWHLNTATAEATAAGYPEPMREPFLWFVGYVRHQCHRNLEVVEGQLKKLGFTTTNSTLSKIIRGRWNKDAEGRTITPVMRLGKFLDMVDALRREDRVAAMVGKVPFVETTTWQDIRDYIDVRRAPDAVCKFGLILGPTGAQKTASLKQYVVRNNHGACVLVDAPSGGSLSEFVTDLNVAYGGTIWANTDKKKKSIAECVNDRKTIIIDNVQRLYKEGAGWSQPVFNYLQKLQDDTGCTIILCAVPEFAATIQRGIDAGYFEQFEGRCGGTDEFLIQPEWTPREDILLIAEAFGLENPARHVGLLEKLARKRGRIRILFNTLQKAKRLAEAQQSTLTIAHLEEVLNIDSSADERKAA